MHPFSKARSPDEASIGGTFLVGTPQGSLYCFMPLVRSGKTHLIRRDWLAACMYAQTCAAGAAATGRRHRADWCCSQGTCGKVLLALPALPAIKQKIYTLGLPPLAGPRCRRSVRRHRCRRCLLMPASCRLRLNGMQLPY